MVEQVFSWLFHPLVLFLLADLSEEFTELVSSYEKGGDFCPNGRLRRVKQIMVRIFTYMLCRYISPFWE